MKGTQRNNTPQRILNKNGMLIRQVVILAILMATIACCTPGCASIGLSAMTESVPTARMEQLIVAEQSGQNLTLQYRCRGQGKVNNALYCTQAVSLKALEECVHNGKEVCEVPFKVTGTSEALNRTYTPRMIDVASADAIPLPTQNSECQVLRTGPAQQNLGIQYADGISEDQELIVRCRINESKVCQLKTPRHQYASQSPEYWKLPVRLALYPIATAADIAISPVAIPLAMVLQPNIPDSSSNGPIDTLLVIPSYFGFALFAVPGVTVSDFLQPEQYQSYTQDWICTADGTTGSADV